MMKHYLLFIFLCLASVLPVAAQMPHFTEGWISVPGIEGHEYGVYYFRKDVRLAAVPLTVRVNVSGDNRYKLFVNDHMVCLGPARSDLAHWNYDVIDLAPYLHAGTNVVVAKVWNEGTMRPEANMTYRTAFMVQAAEPSADMFKTDSSWLCIQDKGYCPLAVQVPGYYAAGPGEMVDMHHTVTDWHSPSASLEGWQRVSVLAPIVPIGIHEPWGTYPGWMVRRSDLPQRYLREQRLAEVRRATGVKVRPGFLRGKAPVTIPANSSAELILDQRELTNAYLSLVFSGGDDARITIGYAEALYDSNMKKGNRNEIEGKHFVGRKDSLISNGDTNQTFTTLAWRTYRYLVLRVSTQGEALTLNDVWGTATGYPFEPKAKLSNAGDLISNIFSIGWRTARLCAVETYMDCPYYEQLQYFGDARIQALVTMFMTGDDRLVKNLFNMADWSRGSDGVTQSRYPSTLPQWIQPYALHYIYALHDYMMYGADMDFLRTKLMSTRTVLDYFHRYQQPDGRVKDLPGWNFTDWVDPVPGRTDSGVPFNWSQGVALPGGDGCNSVMDLQLLYAYLMAADLEQHLGMKAYADLYQERIGQLRESIQQRYWRPSVGLYSDLADRDVWSQHAQALAILTRMVKGAEARKLAQKIESDSRLAPASIYFKYYTHEAMSRGGLADDYLSWLGKWQENIDSGLTTWGETSDVDGTRSDCHAWGASPNVELLRTVLGIDSDAPAFAHVRITPHLAGIKQIGGQMPHPKGMISVSYRHKGNKLEAVVTLPEGVTGTIVWNRQEKTVHGGTQTVTL
jgi:alpha-L-rhamnosidase